MPVHLRERKVPPVRDQTRKTMKAVLAETNLQLDYANSQIDVATEQLAAAKDRRDALKVERDLIKADLDAEPEV